MRDGTKFLSSVVLLAFALGSLGASERIGPRKLHHETGVFKPPRVSVVPAPHVKFPWSSDSNSPSFWHDGTYYQINSHNHPVISSGPDLYQLGPGEPAHFVGADPSFRWIEDVFLRDDGSLIGLYHRENHTGDCPNRPYFTHPDLGLARSDDLGKSWVDLGIVIRDEDGLLSCEETHNEYFGGGVGDGSWIIDRDEGFAYIIYSAYSHDAHRQGLQLARIALADLDDPIGKVWRWNAGQWNEPGLGGHGAALFTPKVSWAAPDLDAFWGPSVHWNYYLGVHVILLNRARNSGWEQEGVYIVYAPDLKDPSRWTEPEKVFDGGHWYAQVIGAPESKGASSLAGKVSRFFMGGKSEHVLVFER